MSRHTAWLLLFAAVLVASGAQAGITSKITGGKPAPNGRFSYSAMIFFEQEGDDSGTPSPDVYTGLAIPLCAGVRIGRAAVLTTASCVYPFAIKAEGGVADPTSLPDFFLPNVAGVGGSGGQTERLRVTLGARPYSELDPAEEDWFDRGLSVRKVVVHPDFDVDNRDWASTVRDNDIAILYLKHAPSVDNTYPTASLTGEDGNQDNWFRGNRSLAAMGWGATNDAGAKASGLRFVEIKRQPDEWCANTFRSYGTEFNRELMFCAASRSGTKKSSCLGDEGAPILYNKATTGSNFPSQGPRTSDVVVGLTSFGPVDTITQIAPFVDGDADFTDFEKRCATNNKPYVYTKVSQYLDWISQMNSAHDADLALAPAVPANDVVEFAARLKCPSKNSVPATNNCYATTNDFLGKPTSKGCYGDVDISFAPPPSNGLPDGEPTNPAASFQGVWFYIDVGPGINPALQNKELIMSTCFSTFDTVIRAFKVNSAFNLTAGAAPDLDDCAGIGRIAGPPVDVGTADAFADDNIDITVDTECSPGTDFLQFRATEDFEIDGTRWYLLVTSSDKLAVVQGARSFTACGTAQVSCKFV